MTDDGWFGEDVAASYDQDAPMFDPAVLEPAVAFLAALAGDGPVLEFAIGTGRIALPLAADRTFTRIVSPRHSRPDTLAPTLSPRPLRAWPRRTRPNMTRGLGEREVRCGCPGLGPCRSGGAGRVSQRSDPTDIAPSNRF
jgi:hypothetical protein